MFCPFPLPFPPSKSIISISVPQLSFCALDAKIFQNILSFLLWGAMIYPSLLEAAASRGRKEVSRWKVTSFLLLLEKCSNRNLPRWNENGLELDCQRWSEEYFTKGRGRARQFTKVPLSSRILWFTSFLSEQAVFGFVFKKGRGHWLGERGVSSGKQEGVRGVGEGSGEAGWEVGETRCTVSQLQLSGCCCSSFPT